MFTGIVKATGIVERITRKGGDLGLRITSGELEWQSVDAGESIAVNGVCLTAAEILDSGFEADVSKETLGVTTLGRLGEGSRVNLELSLGLGERLGGHLVAGHVDCIGTVDAREADARSVRLLVGIPREFSRYVAKKGSVCVDGVSLTVNEVSDSTFDVNIIPHTAEATIIGGYRVGTEVNIEVDLLARYLERLLDKSDDAGITREFLKAHGYAG